MSISLLTLSGTYSNRFAFNILVGNVSGLGAVIVVCIGGMTMFTLFIIAPAVPGDRMNDDFLDADTRD